MDKDSSSQVVLFAPSSSSRAQRGASVDRKCTQNVTTDACSTSADTASFLGLGVDPWLGETLRSLGIVRPTAIQTCCIPAILGKESVLASAPTGSGKTAAFAVPILQDLATDPYGLYAVVLTPTRELALQIAEQFQVMGKAMRLTTCLAVGGLDMLPQAEALCQKPHIIIATPGRLCDLLESTNTYLTRPRYLVFDEADRLLDPTASFRISEIPGILAHLTNSTSLQCLYFSATISKAVGRFHQAHFPSKPLREFQNNGEFQPSSQVTQHYILLPSMIRDAYLVFLLKSTLQDKAMIVFVGKCRMCELLVTTLRKLKIQAVGLHGKMSQRDRLRSVSLFRSGVQKILISTDVGSRGLDIPTAELVVNYTLPADPRDYVHRIGRTGRAERLGTSISFVHESDVELLHSIEKSIGRSLTLYPSAPKETDVLPLLSAVASAKREATMLLHDKKFGEKAEANRKKWSRG